MDKRNLKAIQQAYDQIAVEYARRSFHELKNKPIDRQVLDMFAGRVQGTVCDLGCGPGQVARYLCDRGVKMVGVDLSGAMVEEARRLNPDIEFMEASMYRLPVPNESWGGIAAFYSLIHIPRPEISQVLQELRRVLRPGGLLLVSFHLGQQTLHSERWWDIPVKMDYTYFLSEEMQGYLLKAGFDIEGFLNRPPYMNPFFWESGSYRGFVIGKKRAKLSRS